MRIPLLKTMTLVALTAFSALALADVPARVGRISLAQGQVNISGEVGEPVETALVNWPVTSRNQVSTTRGARTEFRIGSTAVRLDSDSAMDVVELDDDTLHLHLHYGSASIRVRSADVVRGFELSTPQGRVRIKEAGRLRIDAERSADTTVVTVFDGAALVDDGGSTLTVRAGKRVELHNEDVRTALAVRDSFDEWAMLRDQADDRVTSDRYVTSEMTGYEELDRYGVWRDDNEYGPLWSPSRVPVNWAPYRDGRWTYLAPWGWTWVDNAPWGYAPSHYGRWVTVNQRWFWAPGRNVGRPVWAPALVGWIGGSNWNLSFTSRGNRPAQGWYPLAPRDSYVPGYRVSQEHLRHINRHARNDGDRRDGHHRREGLTVVPHEQFGGRGQIVVPNAPRAVVTPLSLQAAQTAAPPTPAGVAGRDRDREFDGRRIGRFSNDNRGNDNRGNDNRGNDSRSDDNRGRDRDRPRQPDSPVIVQQPAPVAAPQPGTNAPVPYSRREGRITDGERRVRVPPMVPMTSTERAAMNAPTPAPAPVAVQQNSPQVIEQPRVREPRPDFGRRMEAVERRQPAPVQPQIQAQPQQQMQVQQPVRQAPPPMQPPQPVRQAPPPPMQPPPQAAPVQQQPAAAPPAPRQPRESRERRPEGQMER